MMYKVTFIEPAEGTTLTETMNEKDFNRMFESSDCRITKVVEIWDSPKPRSFEYDPREDY